MGMFLLFSFPIYFVMFLVRTFYMVAQVVEALHHKWEGRGFDSLWCQRDVFIDLIFPAALWPCGRFIL